MTHDFQPGDTLECVNVSDINECDRFFLQLGQRYTCVRFSNANNVTIRHLVTGKEICFWAWRFKKVEAKHREIQTDDKIVCVNNEGMTHLLTLGKVYTAGRVTAVDIEVDTPADMTRGYFLKDRFKLAEQAQPETLGDGWHERDGYFIRKAFQSWERIEYYLDRNPFQV